MGLTSVNELRQLSAAAGQTTFLLSLTDLTRARWAREGNDLWIQGPDGQWTRLNDFFLDLQAKVTFTGGILPMSVADILALFPHLSSDVLVAQQGGPPPLECRFSCGDWNGSRGHGQRCGDARWTAN